MSGPPDGDGELDWDALAPFWHHFEERGFGSAALSWIEGGLTAPCLYLGAGLGTHAARLSDTLGGGVIMVDASLPMLRRRRAGDQVPAVCADGGALPFRDAVFASVLIATGVLEARPRRRAAVLAEVVRVTHRGGVIIAATIERAAGETPRDTWRGLDDWYRDGATIFRAGWAAFEAVAGELGDRAAAYRLLRHSLPAVEPSITGEAVVEAAGAAGAVVSARLPVGGPVVLYRLTRA